MLKKTHDRGIEIKPITPPVIAPFKLLIGEYLDSKIFQAMVDTSKADSEDVRIRISDPLISDTKTNTVVVQPALIVKIIPAKGIGDR